MVSVGWKGEYLIYGNTTYTGLCKDQVTLIVAEVLSYRTLTYPVCDTPYGFTLTET
jgi:hypothetical protein